MHRVFLWFKQGKKDYPWRQQRTPYSVWVSEVMLQQTRAEVVIPYYERWMKRFPTIEALSLSTLEEVISLWEGLGYYSRARNLHRGASDVMQRFGGKIPSEKSLLLTIKGIGPYTAGAILAFGFGKREPFVDGNIARVIARYLAYEKCVIKGQKELTTLVDSLLPAENGAEIMEGLIELGQNICKKSPKCQECPLMSDCKAFKQGREEELPYRSKAQTIIPLQRQVAIILHEGKLLIKKNEPGKIMADLWEFPYKEADEREFEEILSLPLEFEKELEHVTHHFTKYKATLYPFLFRCRSFFQVKGYEWVDLNQVFSLPFSSGHRRILQQLNQILL